MVVEQKLKYPKSVFFIIINEFCERFSFYGMRTILTRYFQSKLMFSKDTATAIYHTFISLVYFFPLLGAILADSLLGKFLTIFYLSIIYTIGQLLLSMSAAPVIGLPIVECSLFGLFLVALGSGGIKPCVAAFGGDQFVLPLQEAYLITFFSIFYFSINSGSLISSFLTPFIRTNVQCFGENSCYSVAFFIPAVLMALSVVIFVLGKPLYKSVKPTGNVVVNVVKCISHAIFNKLTSKGAKREHWLDHADDKYEPKMIADTKSTLQVLKLFLPLPFFWALYDQQGSRWTLQAAKMDGDLFGFVIEADQMQVINPFLVLGFIPLFEVCIYPLFAKIYINTPLRKLITGGLLAALAFFISAIVELQIENAAPTLPSQGLAHVRLFNNWNCSLEVSVGKDKFTLDGLSMWENVNIPTKSPSIDLPCSVQFTNCLEETYSLSNFSVPSTIKAYENKVTSYNFGNAGLSPGYNDAVDASSLFVGREMASSTCLIRATLELPPNRSQNLEFRKDGNIVNTLTITSQNVSTPLKEIKPNTYDLYANGILVEKNVRIKLGGIYTVVGYIYSNDIFAVKTLSTTQPNSVHMLWQVPQYIILTMAEVMFSVTGLEFAFTQAPVSMKSLLQAAWLLTVAFGNLIVVIVAEAKFFEKQMYEFILFAVLMILDILVFAIIAKFYKYVEPAVDEIAVDDINMEVKNETVNTSYKDDGK